MLEGKTASGFAYAIDEEALDDMEFLENLISYEDGNKKLMPKLCEQFLGKEQKDALYEYCRGAKGRVSASKVMGEMNDILVNVGKKDSDVKN